MNINEDFTNNPSATEANADDVQSLQITLPVVNLRCLQRTIRNQKILYFKTIDLMCIYN